MRKVSLALLRQGSSKASEGILLGALRRSKSGEASSAKQDGGPALDFDHFPQPSSLKLSVSCDAILPRGGDEWKRWLQPIPKTALMA